MPARMVARWGTATFRKKARREVREVLGTSREEAPDVLAAITAAQHLEKIIDMASGGELTLSVQYRTPQGAKVVSWREARQLARGE